MIRHRFNTAQAAEHVGVHVCTVRKALEAGELHGTQRTKAGRWSIRRECLEAWADGEPCPHVGGQQIPKQRAS